MGRLTPPDRQRSTWASRTRRSLVPKIHFERMSSSLLLPSQHNSLWLMLQVSLEALWWVVLHNLTPLNYVLALEASIWFIERAAMEHPKQKVGQRSGDMLLDAAACCFQPDAHIGWDLVSKVHCLLPLVNH
jgi:hypothetical protein